MKRIISVILLVLVTAVFATAAFAQDKDGDGPGREGPSAEGWRGGHKAPPHMVSPEQLASYDEETKAAWAKIHEMEFKKGIGIYLAMGAALAISIAVLGGALGQARVAAAAMEGIARNPDASTKIFTPLIISLALIESLVIYSLVIAFLLQGKL